MFDNVSAILSEIYSLSNYRWCLKYAYFMLLSSEYLFSFQLDSLHNFKDTTNRDTTDVDIVYDKKIDSVKSMSGFLLSLSTNAPHDSLIRELRPKIWRVNFPDICGRVIKLGARAQFVLSDLWGFPFNRKNWLPPYNNFQEWDHYVTKLAKELSVYDQNDILIDFWNEPNSENFWKGSRLELFSTYCRAYRILRKELGSSVKIGGPSISGFNYEFIKEFLEYCRLNDCEVNFISWHEWDEWDSIIPLPERVRRIKNEFQNNPLYSTLHIQEIFINEYSTESEQNSPARLLRYLYYLEKSGVDGACKACWNDKNGSSNCWNNSIDGLLEPVALKPRGIWWIYKYYSDGVDSRIFSYSSNNGIFVFANSFSSKDDKILRIMFSYVTNDAFSIPNKYCKINITGLPDALLNNWKNNLIVTTINTVHSEYDRDSIFHKYFNYKIINKSQSIEIILSDIKNNECFVVELKTRS